MEGLQCRVTELESECDRERVVREEAQRDRDRLKVGGGVHDMTVCCTLYLPVYFCVQCTYKCAPSTYTVHCIDLVCLI